jgi:antitoxin HigA-1
MPRTPIHPGEHLADELQELRMSARELARAISDGLLSGMR